MLLRSGYEGQTITFLSDSQASFAALSKLTIKSDTVEKCLTALNELGIKNKVHLRWVKAHAGIHGNEIADYLAKRSSSLGEGPSDELLTPKVNQKTEIDKKETDQKKEFSSVMSGQFCTLIYDVSERSCDSDFAQIACIPQTAKFGLK